LKELEDSDMIKRTVSPGRPVQIEYSLTEKGKRPAAPLLGREILHGELPDVVFKDGKSYTAEEVLRKMSRDQQ
jgi:hypothetical protein